MNSPNSASLTLLCAHITLHHRKQPRAQKLLLDDGSKVFIDHCKGPVPKVPRCSSCAAVPSLCPLQLRISKVDGRDRSRTSVFVEMCDVPQLKAELSRGGDEQCDARDAEILVRLPPGLARKLRSTRCSG